MAADGFYVDTHELKKLRADIRASGDKVRGKAVTDALKAAAKPAVDDARARASQVSTRIPKTVRATASGTTLTLKAGSESKAPHAKYWNDGVPHPVFARGDRATWTWTKKWEGLHYLEAARDAHVEEIADGIAKGIEAVILGGSMAFDVVNLTYLTGSGA